MKQLDNTPEVYKVIEVSKEWRLLVVDRFVQEQSTRRAFKEHKLKLKSGEMSVSLRLFNSS